MGSCYLNIYFLVLFFESCPRIYPNTFIVKDTIKWHILYNVPTY